MNNLTQNKKDTKKANLKQRQNEMLTRFRSADKNEQEAIIKHINSILESSQNDAKAFWLEFRGKL